MPQPKGARFIRGDVNSPMMTVFLSTKTGESSIGTTTFNGRFQTAVALQWAHLKVLD